VSAAPRSRRRAFATRLLQTAALLVLLGALPTPRSQAGELPDPTRPPTAQRRVAAGASAPAAAPSVPVLQSVLIGEGRKPSAIIDGRLLQLGDALGELRLTRLDETGAVLSGPRGQTLLALTPGADKQVAGTAAAQKLGALAAPGRLAAATPPSLPLRVAEQK
jgi:hypothetical protein